MSRVIAIGLGEILWDVLPDGRKLGGAPANFAYQVNQLGGVGIPVSRIGDDALGREALAILRDNGVSVSHISVDPDHLTGTVDAAIDAHGIATYTFPDEVAWDFLTMTDADLALAARADIICFGTLAQRSPVSRQGVFDCLRAAPDALKIYDINLRQDFHTPERIRQSMDMADVLKLNDDELGLVAAMYDLPPGEEPSLRALMERHDLRLAVLTRGASGSLVLSRDGVSDLAGIPVDIRDTVGAGDAFTAAMALTHRLGYGLDDMNRHAARVAAYVCGQSGAMPPLPDELILR